MRPYPVTEEAVAVHAGAKDRGLLIGRGGVYGNVLRNKRPMCVTRADVDFLADCIDDTFTSVG